MFSRLLRVAISVGLLALLAWVLDAGALAERLTRLRPGWVVIALLLSVPQVVLSAYRWCRTAGRLDVRLSFRSALREYYLAIFLNQVLPGGVVGDVSRAWRHARASAAVAGHADGIHASRVGPEVRAVILERASGQMVMGAVAAISLLSLPFVRPGARAWVLGATGLAGAGVAVAALVARRRRAEGPVRGVWRDVHTALFARDIVGVQAATSVLGVGLLVAMYLAAARAVGVETPFVLLAPLVAPVLLSMVIPATIAGWGVREVTAAAVWSAVGLTPEDGVAISAAYGVVVLLSSLPGAYVLLRAGRGSL